jgi:hypothetical protein
LHNQPLGFLIAFAIPLCAAWTIAGQLRGRDLARDLAVLPAKPVAIGIAIAVVLPWLYKIALVKGWVH